MFNNKQFIVFIILFSLIPNAFSQVFDFLPTSTTNQVVEHVYYSLSYSEEFEQAEWVAYFITDERVNGNQERNNKFTADPYILTKSAKPEDYKKSGYDRGHLAPAADMKFNETAMRECFYMSNMSPQIPAFNRGIWKTLEEKARNWVLQNDTLYIITGGVLKDIKKRIGVNNVGVPDFFYKIILKYSKNEVKAIAFYIPNQKTTQTIYNYVVTIDFIEKITDIDFFPKLSDNLENKLESEIHIELWQ